MPTRARKKNVKPKILEIMKKVVFLIAVFLLSAGISMAQTTIKGKVTSKKDGKALSGAAVYAKEKADIKVWTDASGNYSITVPAEVKNLVISYTGLNSQTVGIGNKTTIDAALNSPTAKIKKNVKSGTKTNKAATNKSK